MNSRPLTPLFDTADELKVLTPAHFLIQRESFLIPEPSRSSINLNHRKRWEFISGMAQTFWKLWSTDYLKNLQQRTKWLTVTRSFKVGDVVLISDANPLESFPGSWPLGLVTAVYPGTDNLVRVVNVKTATSTLSRPAVKLILLVDVDDNKNDPR